MPSPENQFQKNTYVRLPYSDLLLFQNNTRQVRMELRRAFANPLLTVRISNKYAGDKREDVPHI